MMYDAFKLSSLLNVVVGINAAVDRGISFGIYMFTTCKTWFPHTLPENSLNFFRLEQDVLWSYPWM